MQSEPELLTSAEVAAQLQVTRVTVTRWVRDGKLDATHLPGGQLRFRQADVDAMLAHPRGDAA